MRIVVKVGTSTLAHPGGRLNIRNVEELVKVLSDLKNAGHEIILVSSGAIGMGIGKLNMDRSHMDMPAKQAAAAVGQCELMHTYDTLFLKYSHTVGQILITSEDIEDSALPLDEEVERRRKAAKVRSAIDKLDETSRKVILLHYYAGMTVREISACTGISEGTVKSRLMKARKRLAVMLGEEAADEKKRKKK